MNLSEHRVSTVTIKGILKVNFQHHGSITARQESAGCVSGNLSPTACREAQLARAQIGSSSTPYP